MAMRAGVMAGALVALAMTVTIPAGGLQQNSSSGQFGQMGQNTGQSQGQGQMGGASSPGGSNGSGNNGQPSGKTPSGRLPMSDPMADIPVSVPLSQQHMMLLNTQKHKQLVTDTDKLLTLANELKLDVDKSTKDTMSLDVIRKAEEIEKLAHSVKDKMKN